MLPDIPDQGRGRQQNGSDQRGKSNPEGSPRLAKRLIGQVPVHLCFAAVGGPPLKFLGNWEGHSGIVRVEETRLDFVEAWLANDSENVFVCLEIRSVPYLFVAQDVLREEKLSILLRYRTRCQLLPLFPIGWKNVLLAAIADAIEFRHNEEKMTLQAAFLREIAHRRIITRRHMKGNALMPERTPAEAGVLEEVG